MVMTDAEIRRIINAWLNEHNTDHNVEAILYSWENRLAGTNFTIWAMMDEISYIGFQFYVYWQAANEAPLWVINVAYQDSTLSGELTLKCMEDTQELQRRLEAALRSTSTYRRVFGNEQ